MNEKNKKSKKKKRNATLEEKTLKAGGVSSIGREVLLSNRKNLMKSQNLITTGALISPRKNMHNKD